MNLPPPPTADAVRRYERVVVAGHQRDEDTARAHLHDDDPTVRQAALSALVRCGSATTAMLAAAFEDEHPTVRARAAELAAKVDGGDPSPLLRDAESSVVETACFSCGEIAWTTEAPVAQLSEIATSHEDPLCRESAAAALGAIGDEHGLDAVLTACSDRVTVRRRAVLALAAFDDPRADEALQRALTDKDWQVRQAAEDLLEVGRVLDGPADPDAYAE